MTNMLLLFLINILKVGSGSTQNCKVECHAPLTWSKATYGFPLISGLGRSILLLKVSLPLWVEYCISILRFLSQYYKDYFQEIIENFAKGQKDGSELSS